MILQYPLSLPSSKLQEPRVRVEFVLGLPRTWHNAQHIVGVLRDSCLTVSCSALTPSPSRKRHPVSLLPEPPNKFRHYRQIDDIISWGRKCLCEDVPVSLCGVVGVT